MSERRPCARGAVCFSRLRGCKNGNTMDRKYNKNLVSFSRHLRKNMTKEERHLWYDFLKDYKHKFVRQKVLGKYIADFYCDKAKLVIELDGSQHYEDANIENDKKRTAYLEQYNLMILRITNTDINVRFMQVCEHIDNVVKERINAKDIPSVTLR